MGWLAVQKEPLCRSLLVSLRSYQDRRPLTLTAKSPRFIIGQSSTVGAARAKIFFLSRDGDILRRPSTNALTSPDQPDCPPRRLAFYASRRASISLMPLTNSQLTRQGNLGWSEGDWPECGASFSSASVLIPTPTHPHLEAIGSRSAA